ncbi:MAG: fatty acid CoA ligase family protein [Verrucomicrobiota bacterium]
MNIAGYVAKRAEKAPEVLAVRIPNVTGRRIGFRDTTFAELHCLVAGLAAHFLEKGVGKGTRTIVLAKPGLELICGVFAILRVGAVPVVIDPGMGLRSFLSCVKRSEPEAVFGIPKGLMISRVFSKSFHRVRARFSTNLITRTEEADGSRGFEPADTAPNDLAAILFTSGSTGPAKGVCYEHGMFQAQIAAVRERFSIEPGEVDFPMLPVFALFNPALGMTTVVPPMNPSRPAKADPGLQIAVMNEAGVTNSFGSPVLWNLIATEGARSNRSIPSLRRVLAAGAAVSPSLIKKLSPLVPNADIYSPYGATEALPMTAIDGDMILEVAELTEEGKGVCVGSPLDGVNVRIASVQEGPMVEEHLQELSPHEIGEIVVSGPMVTREYDRLEEATRNAKVNAGETVWHRMGDLGYKDEAGRIWFCGRVAERVTTREGKAYYPECCEQVFNRHPKVYRSALVGLGSRNKRVPGIVVQPEKGCFPKNEDEIGNWVVELKKLGSETPMTASIRHFFFRKDFPVDIRHNAKIHRLRLAKEYATHGFHPTELKRE